MIPASPLDRLICNFDQALKTLVPNSRTASRASPAKDRDESELEEIERRHAAGLMRINHTGEVCAQALYQGQALTAALPEVRDSMNQAAREEEDHLCWCEQRLQELDSRPSVLNPLWYSMSLGLGSLAGLAGDRWSLGFVAETEDQVCRHLDEHLQKLPEQDQKSRAILEQMREDEGRHASNARTAGAAPLPASVRQAMELMASIMKKATYRL